MWATGWGDRDKYENFQDFSSSIPSNKTKTTPRAMFPANTPYTKALRELAELTKRLPKQGAPQYVPIPSKDRWKYRYNIAKKKYEYELNPGQWKDLGPNFKPNETTDLLRLQGQVQTYKSFLDKQQPSEGSSGGSSEGPSSGQTTNNTGSLTINKDQNYNPTDDNGSSSSSSATVPSDRQTLAIGPTASDAKAAGGLQSWYRGGPRTLQQARADSNAYFLQEGWLSKDGKSDVLPSRNKRLMNEISREFRAGRATVFTRGGNDFLHYKGQVYQKPTQGG